LAQAHVPNPIGDTVSGSIFTFCQGQSGGNLSGLKGKDGREVWFEELKQPK